MWAAIRRDAANGVAHIRCSLVTNGAHRCVLGTCDGGPGRMGAQGCWMRLVWGATGVRHGAWFHYRRGGVCPDGPGHRGVWRGAGGGAADCAGFTLCRTQFFSLLLATWSVARCWCSVPGSCCGGLLIAALVGPAFAGQWLGTDLLVILPADTTRLVIGGVVLLFSLDIMVRPVKIGHGRALGRATWSGYLRMGRSGGFCRGAHGRDRWLPVGPQLSCSCADSLTISSVGRRCWPHLRCNRERLG